MAKYSDLYFTTQANGNVKGYMYFYDAQGKRKQISKTSKLKKKKTKAGIVDFGRMNSKSKQKALCLLEIRD